MLDYDVECTLEVDGNNARMTLILRVNLLTTRVALLSEKGLSMLLQMPVRKPVWRFLLLRISDCSNHRWSVELVGITSQP